MLYLVGLGLGDAKDITVKGLEIVKKATKVYLENYTSVLGCDVKELEEFYGRTLTLADRDMVEQGCQEILDVAQEGDAAFLVVGDPLNATTHTDLILRAASRKIPHQIVHNASILSAVACCGLQVYNFGETVSIPFWTDTWKPESFYDKILRNYESGLHTLCLLDIKVKEPNLELMAKGTIKMDPPRFMSVSQAAQQLLEIISDQKTKKSSDFADGQCSSAGSSKPSSGLDCLGEDSVCLGLVRVGSSSQQIVKTTLREAAELDLGPPLHSLVIPGAMHPLELEMINLFSKDVPTQTVSAN